MQSKKEKLEAVREKIIAQIPEIMELKFGCFYKYKGRKGVFQVNGDLIKTLKKEDITSLGRPITLEDVLIASDKVKKFYGFTSDGGYLLFIDGTNKPARWQLGKPLDSQDESVLDFLLTNL